MSTKSSQSAGAVVCEHNSLIRRQFFKIESLENELSLLRLERDALLGENERLAFQLQCSTHLEVAAKRNGSKDGVQDVANLNFESNACRQSTSSQTTLTTTKTTATVVPQDCCYELSQHLIDRRVDALERKYGGLVARESATRIQRAFRTYRLQKRFKSIAIQALRQTTDETTRRQAERQPSLSDTQSTRSDDSSSAQNSAAVFIPESLLASASTQSSQAFECQRKRSYRVGLNLFNKHPPERGLRFLLKNSFIESVDNSEQQSQLVARFLLTRKGVSKAMIGEYLSQPNNGLVLSAFAAEIDLSGLQVDSALRKFQTFFRFPGEAQKIERMVDAFATRFVECNPGDGLSRDSVFILSFAIIMLNTDLHAPTNSKNRMTSQQWLQNLRGVFSDVSLSQQFLLDVYSRIKVQELRTGADHVTQVAKVQSAVVSASRGQSVPNLCLEWRRLVCYCRLYEVRDENKKESKDRHQREVFLFNDILLVTKLSARAKQSQLPEYAYREVYALEGLSAQLFCSAFHRFGIRLRRRVDNNQRPLVSFNARNELDQKRFCDDLKESIAETQEMDAIRIHKSTSLLQLDAPSTSAPAPSNGALPPRRKSSSGSLDSGLSLPSRDHSPQTAANSATAQTTS